MALPIFTLFPFLLFIIFHLQATPAAGAVILEDGYTVSTVLVGDKSDLRVNPKAFLPLSPSSDLFILLDSDASTFYTVSMLTNSKEVKIQKLAGNGQSYIDGSLDSSAFYKPKSFAVDFSGNVYVADQSQGVIPRNGVIRRISKSGVTTIAGGYSQKLGHADGPAQNASFSENLVLAFAPERCVLLITDCGSRVIHQIGLKAADCTSRSGSVMGNKSILLLAVGLSCIFGIIVGLLIRPYILPCTGRNRASSLPLDMDALPNESGETSSDALLRLQKRNC